MVFLAWRRVFVMSFTLLSVVFILIFAVIAFKEVYRGAKRGFRSAMISLGADVLALFISFFVSLKSK